MRWRSSWIPRSRWQQEAQQARSMFAFSTELPAYWRRQRHFTGPGRNLEGKFDVTLITRQKITASGSRAGDQLLFDLLQQFHAVGRRFDINEKLSVQFKTAGHYLPVPAERIAPEINQAQVASQGNRHKTN